MYITDLLHIFGAINGPRGGIGFPIGGESSDVRCAFLNRLCENFKFNFYFFLLSGGKNRYAVSDSNVRIQGFST